MNSLPAPLPELQILPLSGLLVHEWYDPQRTQPLQERIQASGVFRNPLIVTPAQDGSARHIILDGANRAAALDGLGCPHALVQVAHPNAPGLRLRTWNHLLLQGDPQPLLERLEALPGLNVTSSAAAQIDLPGREEFTVALLQTRHAQVYVLSGHAQSLEERTATLNRVVNCYKSAGAFDRTSFSEIEPLLERLPAASALLIFPKYTISDLARLACAGALLPPGITRTTISPRALHINLPLQVLMSDASPQAKKQALDDLLAERIAQKRVSLYSEASFFFDE